jgi:hypothetical protein
MTQTYKSGAKLWNRWARCPHIELVSCKTLRRLESQKKQLQTQRLPPKRNVKLTTTSGKSNHEWTDVSRREKAKSLYSKINTRLHPKVRLHKLLVIYTSMCAIVCKGVFYLKPLCAVIRSWYREQQLRVTTHSVGDPLAFGLRYWRAKERLTVITIRENSLLRYGTPIFTTFVSVDAQRS